MENKMTLNRLKIIPIILFAWLFAFVQLVNGQETTWVLDETNDLTQETLDHVTHLNEQVLADYDIEPQLAIEILMALPEEYADIDEYRNERFKELGVGNKEHDSGILLVIALEERKMGIETGYGAEAIVRDIEASQIISGDMKEYLGQYMEESNPDYLNKSIIQATDEIATLLEKGNSGVLFEEREEEQQRLEAEREAQALASQQMKESFLSGVNYILATLAGVLGIAGIRSWYKKKKLKALEEEVISSYLKYYDSELPINIKDEITKQDYQDIFVNNYDTYLDRYAPNKSYDEFWDNKPKVIADIRVVNYRSFIEKQENTKFDKRVYLNSTKGYRENIYKVPNYTIEDHITNVERIHKKKMEKVASYNQQLKLIVDSEVQEYKQAETGYNPWVFDGATIYNRLINHYNLNEEGLINNNYTLADSKKVKSDIRQIVYRNLVDDVMKEEFNDVSFGYGSKNAFLSLAIAGILGSMTYLSRDKLIKYIKNTLGTYRHREEEKEMERIRIAKKRRQEEEERRRRQAAMSSSSSRSSSSSSGGSFGSGFGGGSSGGGGASGGF